MYFRTKSNKLIASILVMIFLFSTATAGLAGQKQDKNNGEMTYLIGLKDTTNKKQFLTAKSLNKKLVKEFKKSNTVVAKLNLNSASNFKTQTTEPKISDFENLSCKECSKLGFMQDLKFLDTQIKDYYRIP